MRSKGMRGKSGRPRLPTAVARGTREKIDSPRQGERGFLPALTWRNPRSPCPALRSRGYRHTNLYVGNLCRVSTARPPRLPRAEREQQILDVAHALFAERGYGAVTMDEVAAEVGVTKPLLYNYFGNKERLFLACVERGADALQTPSPRRSPRPPTPARRCAPACAPSCGSSTPTAPPGRCSSTRPSPSAARSRCRCPATASSSPRLAAAAVPGVLPAAHRRRGRRALARPARRRRGLARWWLRNTDALRPRGRRPADRHRGAGHRPARPHLTSPPPDDTVPAPDRPHDPPRTQTPHARHPPRRHHRRQPHPVRPFQQPVRQASNQDMLTAALDGLVDPLRPRGRAPRRGRRRRRAQAQPRLQPDPRGRPRQPPGPRHAGLRHPAGLRHRPARRSILVANKIALGQIDSGIAGGVDTTSDAPIAVGEDLRQILSSSTAPSRTPARLKALAGLRPGQIVPAIPRNEEPRTGLSMGEHQAITAARGAITREPSRTSSPPTSHQHLAAAYERGFHDDLITPYLGLERDQNLRPDSTVEKLAKLRPVFGGPEGTMTAGNSTPLTDGASVVLLATEEWAKEHGLPVLAYFVDAETAAVDYVYGDEGLLMAPAYAMPRMLAAPGSRCQDFDVYEIHEAFAAQVLSHARRPGRTRSSAGSAWASTAARLDRPRPSSTSTAARWPPGTRSPPPAGASSPAWPRSCTSAAAAAASSPSAPPAARASSRSSRSKEPSACLTATPRSSTSRSAQARRQQLGLPEPVVAGALRARRRRRRRAPCCSAPRRRAPGRPRRRRARARRRVRRDGAARRPATARRRRPRRAVFNPRRRDQRFKALVFDATGIADSDAAERAARASSPPPSASSRPTGGCSCSARRPRTARRRARRTAQRALEGFTRSLAKEAARGAPRSSSTSPRAPRTSSTRRCASCSRRSSAYVDGQVVRIGKAGAPSATSTGSARSAGKVALVTGAARGIGAAIAETLARDGAHVVGLDVPALADDLRAVATSHRRHARSTLDVTARGRARDDRSPRSTRPTAASTSSSTTPASPATRRSPR